jgi:hypothetical protein
MQNAYHLLTLPGAALKEVDNKKILMEKLIVKESNNKPKPKEEKKEDWKLNIFI